MRELTTEEKMAKLRSMPADDLAAIIKPDITDQQRALVKKLDNVVNVADVITQHRIGREHGLIPILPPVSAQPQDKPKPEPGHYRTMLMTRRAVKYRHWKRRDQSGRVIEHRHVLEVTYESGRAVQWQYTDRDSACRARTALELELRKAMNPTQYDALVNKYDRIIQSRMKESENAGDKPE